MRVQDITLLHDGGHVNTIRLGKLAQEKKFTIERLQLFVEALRKDFVLGLDGRLSSAGSLENVEGGASQSATQREAGKRGPLSSDEDDRGPRKNISWNSPTALHTENDKLQKALAEAHKNLNAQRRSIKSLELRLRKLDLSRSNKYISR